MNLANQIIELEKTKSADWDKSSPMQRGEDLSKLIRSSCKDISDGDCVRLSAWVDMDGNVNSEEESIADSAKFTQEHLTP